MDEQVKMALEHKNSLRVKFGLSAPLSGNNLSNTANANLDAQGDSYRHVLLKGKSIRKLDMRPFGGSSLPHEEGGGKYFKKV